MWQCQNGEEFVLLSLVIQDLDFPRSLFDLRLTPDRRVPDGYCDRPTDVKCNHVYHNDSKDVGSHASDELVWEQV